MKPIATIYSQQTELIKRITEQKQFVDMRAASIGDELKAYQAETDRMLAGFSDEKSQEEEKKLEISKTNYENAVKQIQKIEETLRKIDRRCHREEYDKVYSEEFLPALDKEKQLQELKKEAERNLTFSRCQELGEFLRNGKDTGFDINMEARKESGVKMDFCKKVIESVYAGNVSAALLPVGTAKLKLVANPKRRSFYDLTDSIRTLSDRRIIEDTKGRSNYTGYTQEQHISAFAHEYIHYIEDKNPAVLANTLAFFKHRVSQNEVTQKIPNTNKPEYGFKDNFEDLYSGRLYLVNKEEIRKASPDKIGEAYASEVLSTGVQYMIQYGIKEFALKDREYFDFVVATLRGDLWK